MVGAASARRAPLAMAQDVTHDGALVGMAGGRWPWSSRFGRLKSRPLKSIASMAFTVPPGVAGVAGTGGAREREQQWQGDLADQAGALEVCMRSPKSGCGAACSDFRAWALSFSFEGTQAGQRASRPQVPTAMWRVTRSITSASRRMRWCPRPSVTHSSASGRCRADVATGPAAPRGRCGRARAASAASCAARSTSGSEAVEPDAGDAFDACLHAGHHRL